MVKVETKLPDEFFNHPHWHVSPVSSLLTAMPIRRCVRTVPNGREVVCEGCDTIFYEPSVSYRPLSKFLEWA